MKTFLLLLIGACINISISAQQITCKSSLQTGAIDELTVRNDTTHINWILKTNDQDWALVSYPSVNNQNLEKIHPQAWAGNSVNTVIFRKNALVSHGDIQFMAYYNSEGFLCLAKRKYNDEHWEIRQTQYKGNILDAHNAISIMTDGEGYLHVTWNHHGNPLNYVRSVSPLSLDLGDKQAMIATSEQDVTYPEFYKLPDGNLIFMYRDGQSGKGNLVMNRYDIQTKQWQRLHGNLIDGEGQRNAYWQACVDTKGTIHLSWVWRETPDVASNHDMAYAYSHDGGKTWKDAQGKTYRLPITAQSAGYVCRIPVNSELINQTSMTADADGNPYIATYFRGQDSDIPQYHVICKEGGKWKTLNTGFRKTAFSLKGQGTKSIPISRPQIVVNETRDAKQIVLIFRDEERGKKVSVATCTDIQGNQWSVGDRTEYSVGEWEPTYDTELWKDKQLLQLYVQRVCQIDGEGVSNMPVQPISVLTVSLVDTVCSADIRYDACNHQKANRVFPTDENRWQQQTDIVLSTQTDKANRERMWQGRIGLERCRIYN
ncbi:MAG: BNR repeat-containing protein [Dysgonamonadaceae bacterium]|jgi:hypothetical protein|nr:BNR repeat-containing protein [Dysgonamonadaceae bacterium]